MSLCVHKLTLIYSKMRRSKSQDARLVHTLGAPGDHGNKLRKLPYVGIELVPPHLFRPVSHLATVTAKTKSQQSVQIFKQIAFGSV